MVDELKLYIYLIGNLEMNKEEEAIYAMRKKGFFFRSHLLWTDCQD
jgi:hypothetical protein